MRIIFFDKNRAIIEALQEAFDDVNEPAETDENYIVRYYVGDFRDLPKAFPEEKLSMCTAGNSFGIMGGGLDYAIATQYPKIEKIIRKQIQNVWHGELPVGTAVVGRLSNTDMQMLYYTPTMRVPMPLNSIERINIYMAMRAALLLHEFIVDNSVICIPGFGGQCGQVKPKIIAKLMRLGYDSFVNVQRPTNSTEMLNIESKLRRVAQGLE